MAGAAIAAGILLAVALPDRRTDSTVAGAVGSTYDTRPVRLRLAAPASSRVAVVGDFNDWDPAATPLRPAGDGGTWIVELRLRPGRYHYTFLIDGRRWARDPNEPRAAESDFGAPVSVLTVS
jgi:1,4-alpha-glucan branching enzyme